MGRRQIGCVVSSVLTLAAMFGSVPLEAQRIGLYLDQTATVCHGPIEPFGADVHVYLIAFPPADAPVNGALVRIVMPLGLDISVSDPFVENRGVVMFSGGELSTGLTLRFRICQTVSTPLLLGQFGIADEWLGGHRDNLVVQVLGGVLDSTTTYDNPQLRRCEPGNPELEVGYIESTSVNLTFNCTLPNCDCTTGIQPALWTAIKQLYQVR